MTQHNDNGGPAFPIPESPLADGMDLRDYFAAKAMQGMVANDEFLTRVHQWAGMDPPSGVEDVNHSRCVRWLAEYSHQIADAMLAEKRRRERAEAESLSPAESEG